MRRGRRPNHTAGRSSPLRSPVEARFRALLGRAASFTSRRKLRPAGPGGRQTQLEDPDGASDRYRGRAISGRIPDRRGRPPSVPRDIRGGHIRRLRDLYLTVKYTELAIGDWRSSVADHSAMFCESVIRGDRQPRFVTGAIYTVAPRRIDPSPMNRSAQSNCPYGTTRGGVKRDVVWGRRPAPCLDLVGRTRLRRGVRSGSLRGALCGTRQNHARRSHLGTCGLCLGRLRFREKPLAETELAVVL